MKKQLITLILAFLCSIGIAFAETETGTTGDCTYTLDTDEGTLVISGSGAMEDYSSKYKVPWHSDCSFIYTITIESGVTTIGNLAFYDCDNITSITIPSSVTSIGSSAFSGCDNLVSITSLASKPPTIGSTTFSEQYSSAILFAASTKYTTADYWSEFETIVTSNETITGACGDNLTYTLTVSNKGSVSLVIEGSGKMYDFAETSNLPWYTYREVIASVTLPSGLTSIGDYAFSECSTLTSITIPDAVTSRPLKTLNTLIFNKLTSKILV